MAAIYHEDGFYYDYSAPLTQEQREVNATYITRYFRAKGWTDNCIAGLLGNFYAESNINPARWQGDVDHRAAGKNNQGFGLAQWTPWRKYTLWCEDKGIPEYHMGTACLRIWTEFENVEELKANSSRYGSGQYYSTDEFPVSRSAFIHSTDSPEYLAKAFVQNYERPASVLYTPDKETYEEHLAKKKKTHNARASYAASWYAFITGGSFPDGPPPDPDDPTPDTGSGKSFLPYLTYYRRRRYVVR